MRLARMAAFLRLNMRLQAAEQRHHLRFWSQQAAGQVHGVRPQAPYMRTWAAQSELHLCEKAPQHPVGHAA